MPADAINTPVDTWVAIKGTLAGTPGKDLTVAATNVTKVAQPENPYG